MRRILATGASDATLPIAARADGGVKVEATVSRNLQKSGQRHAGMSGGARRRAGIAAFSLIEILVVLVIVSVLALAVSISIASAGGERQLTREAERLQALLEHACRQAELGGREIGLRIGARGYAFAMLGLDGWELAERKDELRAHDWVPGLRLELLRDGRPMGLADADAEPPQLVCFSSGELSPFLLRLELGDVGMRYELRGDVQGSIALKRVEIRP